MSDRLAALLSQPTSPRILVIGDVMLDDYVWGAADRISPEAPVAVLRVTKEEHRLGGAGNVAAMLAALDCRVELAGIVGPDHEAHLIHCLLAERHISQGCLLEDASRTTTRKQRLLGASQQHCAQQMLRIDREDRRPLEASLAEQVLDGVAERIPDVDLVVVSDYGKGVCAGELPSRVVQLARRRGVPVIADPVCGTDFRRFAGCRCITPNRRAAAEAAGMPIASPQQGLEAARRLLDLGVEAAAVTLDRDGIAWADRQGRQRLFPTRARPVCDVTGAGDMVLAALAYALAAGADFDTAVRLANVAGGLEVEHQGVVALTRRELREELSPGSGEGRQKIVSLAVLREELAALRRANQRIVMTHGCFDLLHPGHVLSLQLARRLGDCLVVGLNSDASVRALKGPTRPIVNQAGRSEMLAALACVDYVILFDEPEATHLVEQILPDVLVKADHYTPDDQAVGQEILEYHGGSVVAVPAGPHYSTSELIRRIRSGEA